MTGPTPRPTARAWRSAKVAAILASTAASATTQPSARADASAEAKVQPVPWLCGLRSRGRLSQPVACGLSSQSSDRPASGPVAPASPPVITTAAQPSARRARACAGMSVGAPPGVCSSRATASAWLGVMTVARGNSRSR